MNEDIILYYNTAYKPKMETTTNLNSTMNNAADAATIDATTHKYNKRIAECLAILADRPDLQVFIRDFNEEGGFIWSSSPTIYAIHDLIGDEKNSPSSFALELRGIQQVLLAQQQQQQ